MVNTTRLVILGRDSRHRGNRYGLQDEFTDGSPIVPASANVLRHRLAVRVTTTEPSRAHSNTMRRHTVAEEGGALRLVHPRMSVRDSGNAERHPRSRVERLARILGRLPRRQLLVSDCRRHDARGDRDVCL